MKSIYLKSSLLLTALLLFFAPAIHAQNSLKVADVTAGPGEKSNITIELNNTGNVVGFQFTLTVPTGLIVSEKAIQFTSRKGDHVVYPKKVNNTQYLFISFSPTNESFSGNSGALLEIPIEIPINYPPGNTYPLSLSGVILSSMEGVDIGSNHQDGTLLVGEAKTPDLEVSGVAISGAEISPAGTVSVSWGIKNIGNAVAAGGWTEQVSLISVSSGDRYTVGSVSFTGEVVINETVSRNGTFNVPKIVGMDGEVKVEVNMIPSASIKELESDKANNKAQSSNSVNLKKALFLMFNRSQIDENATVPARATLSRSGGRSAAEEFQISCSMNDQFTFPASVSIAQNQSSAAFDLQPIDNAIADGSRTVSFTVSGNGYTDASQDIIIVDDEIGIVTMSSSQTSVTDGDQITITLQTDITRTQDATFTLTADQATRWTVPATVLLPAGSKTVTFSVDIKALTTPEPTVTGKITAKAEGYKAGLVEVVIVSANIPAFEFTIEPDTISKGDGPYATYAVIKRLDKPQVAVTIRLSADIANTLLFPSSVNFPAGVTQQKFNIGAISNDLVDGTKVVTVKASLYLASCNCTCGAGVGGAELTQDVTILDDNGLALKIKANPGTVKAGQTDVAKITITRNTTDLSEQVNLRLSTDMPSVVTIPATAVIPVGQASVDVFISTIIDPEKIGDQAVRIQAEADDYSTGFNWILVSDQNKPDAAVTEVTVNSPLTGGSDIEVKATIANQGFANLVKGSKVEYYLSKNNSTKSGILIATNELDSDIGVEAQVVFTRTIQLPDKAGDYYLIVTLNSDLKIDELSFANNQSEAPVQLMPAYTATVAVNKTLFKSEETVNISGTARFANNNPVVNKEIEVNINNNGGFSRSFTTTTNESGDYAYSFQPLPGENGHYTVSAGYPGADNQAQTEFDLAGFEWKNKPTPYLFWEVIEFSTKEGEFMLKNNTNITLSNVRVVLPENAGFTLDAAPVNIPAGGTVPVQYSITPSGPTAGRDYIQTNVQIVSDEGGRLDVVSWYYCRPQTAKLTPIPVSINTTMTKGMTRNYEITLINSDVEAKDVNIYIPTVDWLSMITPQNIPVVAPFDTVKVVLQMKPTDQLQLNAPISGSIAVTISNGNGFQIPFKVEPVSEATGSIEVDVVDDYTYNTESAPHLADARVIIRHPYSGAVIAEGYTNNDGLFNVDNIPEGYYTINISANKHNNYQNNILIDPGKTNRITAFLAFQAISYSWNVVPTEIEDTYQTDITVQFETNVPRPVVVFEYDKTPIDLQPGESKMLYISVVNYGLIKAFDLQIVTTEHPDYTFTLLADYFPALNAKSSVTVPLLIQRNSSEFRASATAGCGIAMAGGLYYIKCGPEAYQDNVKGKIPILEEPTCEAGPLSIFQMGFAKPGSAVRPSVQGQNIPQMSTAAFPIVVKREIDCSTGPNIQGSAPANDSGSDFRQAEAANASSSVCATVTVQFSQAITLTREAFEGTLTLNNGGDAGTITNVNLDLIVYDENGEDATHLFQVNRDAFLSGSGSVGAQNEGTGTVIFIPTKLAAPTVPLSYSFGGTLSYIDPGIDEKVTVQLFPVTLEVHPSPDLVLQYFMQRDILGDDPLTLNIVEPSVPAELALMIINEGYGTANNVKVESMQPEIIDNEKGLLIDFTIVGSNFNNEPKQLGLLNVNFGNIEPGKSAVGQWWFTSTLIGHFIDYKINVTHLNSFGNKNLSLIKDYQLHELIKSVKAYGTGHDDINDFLVNDIPDPDNEPDAIYYSTGDRDEVYTALEASASNQISASRLTATLSVTPYMMGWNYGNINDPGSNHYQLVKVVRNSDSYELPMDNFWQTFVTMKDGSNPLYENKLHFLDKITVQETYTLYYTPIDTDYPKVVAFENVPAEMVTQPVEFINVKFNKPIDATTFTTDNISLIYQGSHIPVDDILIGKIDDETYSLNLQAVTIASGYYELAVQCVGIKDLVGNEGQAGKSVNWLQVMGELAIMSFSTDQVKSQPLNSVEVFFNKTVAPNQFTKDKITLNGEPLGENVSIITEDNLHYAIVGLSAYNILSGGYELTVDLPAIRSENNIQGLIAQSCKWRVEMVMPAVNYFIPVYQGALNSQNVTGMQVTLTKPITDDFDIDWVTLYKGSENMNALLNVSMLDSINYLISGLGEYTYASGGYRLSVDQTGFVDSFGNVGVGQTDTIWTVSFVIPASPANMKITPDRGVSATDNITSGNDLSITFNTLANQQTVALYAVSPQGETLVKEQYLETAGTLTVPISGYSGKITFKAIVTDSYGNESNPVSINVFIDDQDLSAEIIPVKVDDDGCFDELDYVSVEFTDDIIASDFINEALSLSAAGISLPTGDIMITPISDREFKLENFGNINNNGDISIGVNLAMLQKKQSGLPGAGSVNQNMGNISIHSAQISGDDVVLINETTTYTATPDMIDYSWQVTGGTIVATQLTSVSVRWNTIGNQTVTLSYTTPNNCEKTSSIAVQVKSDEPAVIAWQGSVNSDWSNYLNWEGELIPSSMDVVVIPSVASDHFYPVLTKTVEVAEIHFEPGAQIGNQHLLEGKAFVKYDLSVPNRWHMLSMPLGQAYPGDFAFGGYPLTWVRTFEMVESTTGEGSITKGAWVTARASEIPISYGEGFVLWLDEDNSTVEKGLKLLGGVRELPFFHHHATGSPDRELYEKVHQSHDYNSDAGQSTFYNYELKSGEYVRKDDQFYSVPRDPEAYSLAGVNVSKILDYGTNNPGTGGKFALAGNPYMAALEYDKLYSANPSVIKNSYHVWTGLGYTTYTPFGATGVGSTGDEDQLVAPLQAFIVEKPDNTVENELELQFSIGMTSVNSDVALRSSSVTENRLEIAARNPVAGVRTFIVKREGGQDTFGELDSRKIINGISDVPEVYTLKPYKNDLIATVANVVNNDDLLIPVGLATSYTGDVTLSFSGMDTYDAGLSLIDVATNRSFDLTGMASCDYVIDYTPKKVNGEPAVCEDRFFIRISKTATGTEEITAEKVNVFEKDGLIRVISGASNPIEEVSVYSLQGALLYKEASIHAISHIVNRSWPDGVYLVKVISEKNTDNFKVIIH